MKRWRALVVAAALIGAAGFVKREPIVLGAIGFKTPRESPAEREALLQGGLQIITPEGDGPFPVVLQFHGCAGIREPFQRQWAEIAVAAGYAAVIVDSNGPRGFDRETALETVCGGKALLGQERAGDVAAAIEIIAKDQRLDQDRLILAGWSHGAWSVMDYLSLEARKAPPPGLTRWPRERAATDGVILFYPYCGLGARTRFARPAHTVETLVLLGDADEVVDAEQCIAQFRARRDAGEPIDLIIYPGTNHVFDDPFLEPDYLDWYDENFHADAKARYGAFLLRINAASG